AAYFDFVVSLSSESYRLIHLLPLLCSLIAGREQERKQPLLSGRFDIFRYPLPRTHVGDRVIEPQQLVENAPVVKRLVEFCEDEAVDIDFSKMENCLLQVFVLGCSA